MKERPSVETLVQGILNQERYILSRAITLIESQLPDDRQAAEQLLTQLLPHTGNSFRIGITGVPGVGKSTFIDQLGKRYIEEGHKVAVLAVDPSSPIHGGSILGDKTRMNYLASRTEAFIRPSAAGETLGGVGSKTLETLLLCEAAGYTRILIETVGVGQSEVLVQGMTDFFLLLLLPGAGDELQGIKKGIVEMADGIVIHKADPDQLDKAKNARAEYRQALHLLPLRTDQWTPEIVLVSSLFDYGWKDLMDYLAKYHSFILQEDRVQNRRKQQFLQWMDNQLKDTLWLHFRNHPEVILNWEGIHSAVKSESISVSEGVRKLLSFFEISNSYR